MDAITQALIKLKALDGAVTSEIIKDLIKDHEGKASAARKLYNEYDGKVNILKRQSTAKDKIINKIANDYRGYIVDTMHGYFLGNPIMYNPGTTDTKAVKFFEDFKTRNNIADQDSKTGLLAATCGYTVRLLYVNTDGDERILTLDPWEVIMVGAGDQELPQYALRYYTVQVQGNNKSWTERKRVEWYDPMNVTFYIELPSGEYMEDPGEASKPHLFEGVPLVKFKNNDQDRGDFEKVSSIVDAYDRDISYNQDEEEAFRHAYLLLKGITLEDDEAAKIKDSRVWEIGEESDAAYLTKDINDNFNQNHLDRLEKNIHKFSRIPDMSDENFSGTNQSGESRKWKLVGMETKAGIKELKFTTALRDMFKLLTAAWKKKGYNIDYLAIQYEFTRKLPVELAGESEVTKNLKGMVAEKTRLGLLSFIDDVDAEMKAMEKESTVDLDNVPDFGGEDG